MFTPDTVPKGEIPADVVSLAYRSQAKRPAEQIKIGSVEEPETLRACTTPKKITPSTACMVDRGRDQKESCQSVRTDNVLKAALGRCGGLREMNGIECTWAFPIALIPSPTELD